MRDADIRTRLKGDLQARYQDDPDTLILEELGICRGAVRVDVAVVNGLLAGYEIKSEQDTLERLPSQAAAYGRVFDRVTLVTSGHHLDRVDAMIPVWWGLTTAAREGGGVALHEVRTAQPNPAIEPLSIAQLLWRDEVLGLLDTLGLRRGLSDKTRPVLWALLAEALPVDELREVVRRQLRGRDGWRSAPAASPRGETSPPRATLSDSPEGPCPPRTSRCNRRPS